MVSCLWWAVPETKSHRAELWFWCSFVDRAPSTGVELLQGSVVEMGRFVRILSFTVSIAACMVPRGTVEASGDG